MNSNEMSNVNANDDNDSAQMTTLQMLIWYHNTTNDTTNDINTMALTMAISK